MNSLTVSASPHITKKENTTRNIMLDVIIALMPALIAATFYFGLQVIINAVVCVLTCFGAELLFSLIKRKKFDKEGVKKSSVWDLSCIVTGIILALNLPSAVKISSWDFNIYQRGFATRSDGLHHMVFSGDAVILCIIGSIFAILVVKMLFGGIGKNFANPAATARIFLFICFGLMAVNTMGSFGVEATTGATWLSTAGKPTKDPNLILNYFLGNRGAAAAGETCIAAILLGYIYLSVRKVIDFRLPLIIIGSAAVFAFFFDSMSKTTGAKMVNNLLMHLMSGGLVFGAVFMATDYSSSPNTFWGQAIFGVGIALITMLIRVYAQWPEGVSFAIVFMNILSPLIDKYIVPKPFGYEKQPKKKDKRDKTVKEPGKIKLNQEKPSESKTEVKA